MAWSKHLGHEKKKGKSIYGIRIQSNILMGVVFMWKGGDETCLLIICVYVDGLMLTGNNDMGIEETDNND